jgi:hypothetical protein
MIKHIPSFNSPCEEEIANQKWIISQHKQKHDQLSQLVIKELSINYYSRFNIVGSVKSKFESAQLWLQKQIHPFNLHFSSISISFLHLLNQRYKFLKKPLTEILYAQ